MFNASSLHPGQRWSKKKISTKPLLASSSASKPIIEQDTAPLGSESTLNKGIGLDDLFRLVKKKESPHPLNQESPKEKIQDIERLWSKIKEEYAGDKVIQDFIQTLVPEFKGFTLQFRVGNMTQGGMIEKLFPTFYKIAKLHSELEIQFQCLMDEELAFKEDLSKKERFEELAKRYPIVLQLKDEFKWDFNT